MSCFYSSVITVNLFSRRNWCQKTYNDTEVNKKVVCRGIVPEHFSIEDGSSVNVRSLVVQLLWKRHHPLVGGVEETSRPLLGKPTLSIQDQRSVSGHPFASLILLEWEMGIWIKGSCSTRREKTLRILILTKFKD